ncbi:MAG: DUF2520 domain-containing protein, partial [Gemmatimonadota bacterium]|nr:DUF2520 domain-containing protein [Gemmatimonadota bacterium]
MVGGGRLGRALSAALPAAGIPVRGPLGRGARVEDAAVVLLCVPDREIAAAAAAVPPGRLVGHCSGAATLAPLAPHEGFSLHPLLSVAAGRPAAFAGAGCAVAGATPRALDLARALAGTLRMTPVEVADADRALYHAAASVASNYLVTLESAAAELGARAGVPRELLVQLARTSMDHWAAQGARALTGPIARGDDETVARQRAAVAERAPELLPLWDALAERTAA